MCAAAGGQSFFEFVAFLNVGRQSMPLDVRSHRSWWLE